MLADFLNAAAPAGQQQQDGAAHIVQHGFLAHGSHGLQQLLGIAHHGRVGKFVARIEIGLDANNAVELLIELHARAEHQVMHAQVLGRGVLETHHARLPVATYQLPNGAHHHAQRQLHALARRLMGTAGQQQLTDQHRVGLLIQLQRHGAVEQGQMTHQQVQRIAQRSLIANQQAHRPHIGQQARARHAQTKAFIARLRGRGLQQTPHLVHRNHQIRLVEHTGAQAGIEQHARAIQPRSLGDFGVIGQAGCANERGHGVSLTWH